MHKKSKELREQGYIVSEVAADLIDRGFQGNGCGSGMSSFFIAHLVMLLFTVDFSTPCLIHDADFSESRSTKTNNKKIDANANLEKNCLVAAGRSASKRQHRAAMYFHGAVVFFSNRAYWKA